MENKKPTQFLMKPKVDFCFKELMEDEEVRNAFLAAVLGINLEEINESKICRPICVRRIKTISWGFWMYGFY